MSDPETPTDPPAAGRCRTCRGEGEIETGQTTAARCVDCAGTGRTGGEPPNRPLSASPPAPTGTDTFWVLEKPGPTYWDGGHAESATKNINAAIQWRRKRDVFPQHRHLAQWGWKIVEHGYIHAAPTGTDAEVAELVERLQNLLRCDECDKAPATATVQEQLQEVDELIARLEGSIATEPQPPRPSLSLNVRALEKQRRFLQEEFFRAVALAEIDVYRYQKVRAETAESQLTSLRAELEVARKTLAKAAIPLEALRLSECDAAATALTGSLKASIVSATDAIRATLVSSFATLQELAEARRALDEAKADT